MNMSRDDRIIERNIRLHEREAERYEDSKVDIFNEQEQERLNSILGKAVDNISTNGSSVKALDIGCGTGNVLEKLGSSCDKVVGLDLSEDMLSMASSNHLGEEENLSLIRGRAAHLPFDDNVFDIVTVYSVLHHLPHFPDPISEITRVLKPGGVLYIDHEPIERENPLVKLYIEFCYLLNERPSDGTEGLDRKFCDYHIHRGSGGIPVSRILRLCRKNGIEILNTEKYLAYSSRKMNPLHPLFKRLVNNEWLLIGRKEEARS